MNKTRLEAFSDGVIAILITIMVLEFKLPHGDDWAALRPLLPVVMTYLLSFVFLGTYWNNHHHLLHATSRINGGILWANLHLMFWLSLTPFATGWMGEHPFAPTPTAVYGAVQFLSGAAYKILQHAIVTEAGPRSALAAALARDTKGKVSVALYAVAIPLAYLNPWVSAGLYVCVALLWLVPDRRLEGSGTAH